MINFQILATEIKASGLPHQRTVTAKDVATILSIVFAIIGALAFLAIVIAGLRYVSAAGDPGKTAQAKNTVIFAVVGLAIAVFAQAIVAFVVRRVGA